MDQDIVSGMGAPQVASDARSCRDALVGDHLGLARSLALRYQGRGVELDDLVQTATLGLIKAADRFEVDRGVAFSTFAVPTILGEIRRHFRDQAWAVHVPRGMKDRWLRVKAAREQLASTLARVPTLQEIAAATDLDDDEVLVAIDAGAAFATRSLEPADMGTAVRAEAVNDDIDGVVRITDLRRALRTLDTRSRTILALRYGDEFSQADIGERVGLSQMHISRLLRRLLDGLQDQLAA